MTSPLDDTTVDHLRRMVREDAPDHPRYCIGARIGAGGMGTVYLADDLALGRPVAMKVLRDGDPDGSAAERLSREAQIIAGLEHPGIVPVHDVGQLADGRVFYVMKWVKGQRLDEYLAEPASVPQRLRVFERVCETVAFAHARGVIHRDLKPQNVMLGEFGEVLVLDWGVAKIARDGQERRSSAIGPSRTTASSGATESLVGPPRTAFGTVMGTPAYMAPEQARGAVDQVDERSDVYALGGILYFLLTGRAPQSNAAGEEPGAIVPPRQLNPAVPRRLQSICLKALAPLPCDRFGSAAELAADLSRYLNGQAVSAHREGVVERLWRWAGWYRTPILLITAYLLMRALLVLWQRR